MLQKLRRAWRSFRFKETQLRKGSTFFGPASRYMDASFEQGTQLWKDSTYSFKLVVDRIENNKVYYFSYYIDPEGSENIGKHVKFIATTALLRDVNRLRLWAE